MIEKTINQNIDEQLTKLEKDTDLTSESNFALAQNWEKWNNNIGITIVFLSAIVTSLSAISSSELQILENKTNVLIISTLFGSIIAGLGSILTTLKPAERAARYREFGNKHKSIRNRIRIYRTVSINLTEDVSEKHVKLQDFLAEKDTLNSDNPPIAKWAFTQATDNIKRKEEQKEKNKTEEQKKINEQKKTIVSHSTEHMPPK